MYGKYFASTFTGSMVGAGINVFAVWGYIIANCKNGSVELNPKLLSMILGCDESDVNSALEFLESPDPSSRSKEKDGRRIVKIGPYFYEVPNHASYRKILNDDERREYFRDKKREERQKKKGLTVGQDGLSKTVKDMSTVSTQAEAESETKAEKKKPLARPAVTDEEWIAEIEKMECYKPLSVQSELGKAKAWCSTRPGKQCTRRFFINWLNRSLDNVRTVSDPTPRKQYTLADAYGTDEPPERFR